MIDSIGTPAALHRWLERALMVFGAGCLSFYLLATAQTVFYQSRAKMRVNAMIAASRDPELPSFSGPIPKAEPIAVPLQHGELIGRVDVPRLNLSAAIAEGDDASALADAVGHLPDTALPWQRRGNVALAAHRDTLFRPLKDIRVGDEVRVSTREGDYRYRVTATRVVDPTDVWVLNQTLEPTLTLITCYPFYFVGHAPHRFIVKAERISPEPAGVPLKGTVAH